MDPVQFFGRTSSAILWKRLGSSGRKLARARARKTPTKSRRMPRSSLPFSGESTARSRGLLVLEIATDTVGLSGGERPPGAPGAPGGVSRERSRVRHHGLDVLVEGFAFK